MLFVYLLWWYKSTHTDADGCAKFRVVCSCKQTDRPPDNVVWEGVWTFCEWCCSWQHTCCMREHELVCFDEKLDAREICYDTDFNYMCHLCSSMPQVKAMRALGKKRKPNIQHFNDSHAHASSRKAGGSGRNTDVCSRTQTYAHVCSRMLTYAEQVVRAALVGRRPQRRQPRALLSTTTAGARAKVCGDCGVVGLVHA